jgi:hypothetical protein
MNNSGKGKGIWTNNHNQFHTIFKSVLFKQEKERITVGGVGVNGGGLCWWKRDVEARDY